MYVSDTARLTSGMVNTGDPPSQIRGQVDRSSRSPAFGPFGDYRSASRTLYHCPTPVEAPLLRRR